MYTLRSLSSRSPHLQPILFSNKPFFSFFSALSSFTEPSNPNALIVQYLVDTFKLPKTQAILISNSRKKGISTEKPQSVFNYLQELGFSDTHVHYAVRASPQILFSDVDKTLKPKVKFFQDLGLNGSELGKFIAKNSSLLTVSLEKKLVPCVEILKKVLSNDEDNRDLIRVLRRCSYVLTRHPESKLLVNIDYLRSIGIVGSQLSMLLKRQPRLFSKRESALRELVSVVLGMGFSLNSGMLVHGLHTISCVSSKTYKAKLDLFRSFGFTEEECMIMIRKAPVLLRTSGEKLTFGIEFFMHTMNVSKSLLIHRPSCLMHSMEERVIPRYKVLQILRLKKLLKKDPSFFRVLVLTEGEFLEKYISRFSDHVEELLLAYRGHLLGYFEQQL